MSEENPNSPKAIGRRLWLLRLAVSGEDHQTRWVESFHSPLITTGSWGNWEHGRNRPSGPPLDLIIERTKAPSDYILFGRKEHLPYALARKIEKIEQEMDEAI